MKKLTILSFLIIVLIIGGLAAADILGETRKNYETGYKITCQPNQKIFWCDCDPNYIINFDRVENWTENKVLYLNYTAEINFNNKCLKGLGEKTINYTGDPEDAIERDIYYRLQNETLANKQPPIKELPKGGGTIKPSQ